MTPNWTDLEPGELRESWHLEHRTASKVAYVDPGVDMVAVEVPGAWRGTAEEDMVTLFKFDGCLRIAGARRRAVGRRCCYAGRSKSEKCLFLCTAGVESDPKTSFSSV